MSKPVSTNVPQTASSEKTRSATALQQLVANTFLNSGDPVVEHVMNKSRPVAAYSKLDQVK